MFQGINKQAIWIAKIYKFLGLYSIPILTLATTISIANVFVRGQLAMASWVEFVWAVIFAVAIEVNIVRLFFEAKVDHDNVAKTMGIILLIVAGMALVIEGLQQSIGFDWSNIYAKVGIVFVIVLRVFVVVLLLAREGSKLGAIALDMATLNATEEPPVVATSETTPEATEPVTEPLHLVKPKPRQNTATRISAIVAKYPTIKNDELARKLKLSERTVQRYRKELVS